MPKKRRLSRAHFVALKGARRIHGTLFTLSVAPLPEADPPLAGAVPAGRQGKFACVVSKKVSAKAVDRNRIKRRCRESVRAFLSTFREPLALVFTAKRVAGDASSADIAEDVRKLLIRVA